jgi:putative peptidoglycan binding protein
MNYKRLIAVTVGLTVFAFTDSNAMAHGGGGGRRGAFGGGGFRGGFNGGGFGGGVLHRGFAGGRFRDGFRGGDFRGAGFRGGFRGSGFRRDQFHHRDFDDRFFFFGDFPDPFFYYPYPYYGYYPYGYYPYDYGYQSYGEPGYQGSDGYTDSVIGEVQLRLARAGYYHGAIDGVSGSETRRAIRAYEQAHALPQDGRIGQRLLTTMGLS